MTLYDATTWKKKTKDGLKFLQFCVYILSETSAFDAMAWKYKTEHSSYILQFK